MSPQQTSEPDAVEVVRRLASRRGLPCVLGLLASLAAACGGGDRGATAPQVGVVRVSTVTTGEDRDPDGYRVQLSGGAAADVRDDAPGVLAGVPAGVQTATLGGLAANCQATGGPSRSVSVVAGDTAAVSFAVACASTHGTLVVAVTTEGRAIDRDGYAISIDGSEGRALPVNDALSIELPAGDHSLALSGLASNCAADAPLPSTARVTAAQTTRVTLHVTCRLGRIVYGQYDGRGSQLFAVEPDGSARLQLTSGAGESGNPAWSPDRTRVAYSFKAADSFSSRIAVIAVDGSPPRFLTTDSEGRAGGASWSPDGARIAFSARPAGSSGGSSLYVMNADGTGLVQLTTVWTVDDLGVHAWSPDGARLLFSGKLDPATSYDLFVVGTDGAGLRRLTSGPSDETEPTWSPDGTQILFSVNSTGLAVLSADGSVVDLVPDTPATGAFLFGLDWR